MLDSKNSFHLSARWWQDSGAAGRAGVFGKMQQGYAEAGWGHGQDSIHLAVSPVWPSGWKVRLLGVARGFLGPMEKSHVYGGGHCMKLGGQLAQNGAPGRTQIRGQPLCEQLSVEDEL